MGRWLTPDPLGFIDGSNLYLYVNNNPLNLVDPYGLWRERILNALYPNFSDPTSWDANFWINIYNDFSTPQFSLVNTAWPQSTSLNLNDGQVSVAADPTQLVGTGINYQSSATSNNTFAYIGINKYLSIGLNSSGVLSITIGIGEGWPWGVSHDVWHSKKDKP